MKKLCLILLRLFLFSAIGISIEHAAVRKDNPEVNLVKNHIMISVGKKKLVEVTSINFNFTPPKSISEIKKSYNEILVKVVYPAVAWYGDASSDLTDTIRISKVSGGIRFYCDPTWARNVTIQLKDQDEHYFGVVEHLYPNNKKSPDLRGQVVDVEVIGGGNQYHENYASIWSAFYMSSRDYASFFDTFAEGRYTFGINGVTELYHHTGKLDWYIFTGQNGDDILQSYYSVIGRPKYVPIWACGPITWRDQDNGGKDEILDDIQKMTDLKIPLTAWFVDRPYSDGANAWSKMNFSKKFSDPKDWISEIINKYGLQFMTWVGPMTFGDRDFPGLLPNYKGYIDLTNPVALKEFEKRLKDNQYSVNVRGHKMDRADEDFPVTSAWYDGTPEFDRRNKYIFLYSKVINKFLHDSFGKDEFNFARAAFQRCQPYLSAVWGGDARSSWDGLACSIAIALRCGYMGFPVWGSDVGGYLGGSIPEKLYARWIEFGLWCGLYETKIDNSGGQGKERLPWKYSVNLQKIYRESCRRRMEMIPYIYSEANTSYKNGILMKPLSYEYPSDTNTYDIWNEYLFGNAFLVAPVFDSTNSRKIYLPAGKWYDFYNFSKSYNGGKNIKVEYPVDRIPVFIKRNSIYITGNIYEGNSRLWEPGLTKEKNLNIFAFLGKAGEMTMFTYIDYNDGDNEKNILLNTYRKKINLTVDAINANCTANVKVEQKPIKVLLNDKPVDFSWNKTEELIRIKLESGSKNSLKIIFD